MGHVPRTVTLEYSRTAKPKNRLGSGLPVSDHTLDKLARVNRDKAPDADTDHHEPNMEKSSRRSRWTNWLASTETRHQTQTLTTTNRTWKKVRVALAEVLSVGLSVRSWEERPGLL